MQLIILAGGRNSRIQTKKALLSVGGRPIIERIIDRLGPLADGCLIVTGDPEAFAFTGAATTPDQYPGKGPQGGLHAGLAASPSELNLVVACDMPFVSAELAALLVEEAAAHSECDAVVPCWEKGREPLFAVYRKRAAEVLAARLEAGELRMGTLSSAIPVREIDLASWAGTQGVDLARIFSNVNTWEDWRRAEAAARAEVEAGGPPLLAVVGWQDAGKTTVTAALVRELSQAGLRVAVLKHDPHGHETDTPGKDTYVHRQAGAAITALAGPKLLSVWETLDRPLHLRDAARRLPPVDLVLAEGWKGEPVPRVVVLRGNPELDPLTQPGEVVAVIGEGEAAGLAARLPGAPPLLAPGDSAGLAAVVLRRFGLGGQ